MDFVAVFQKEWPVISQAPWSAAVIAVTFLAIGWAVGRFLGSERIRNLLSRIDRRDDEIAALKEKLAALPSSPDRKAVRIALSKFMAENDELAAKCGQKGELPPIEAMNDWVGRVSLFLNEKLDASYALRLMSNSGLLAVHPRGEFTDEQRKAVLWLHYRKMRLNEFLSELA